MIRHCGTICCANIKKVWGAGLSSENKDKWDVIWLQQAESISQEKGDMPDKAEREEE